MNTGRRVVAFFAILSLSIHYITYSFYYRMIVGRSSDKLLSGKSQFMKR